MRRLRPLTAVVALAVLATTAAATTPASPALAATTGNLVVNAGYGGGRTGWAPYRNTSLTVAAGTGYAATPGATLTALAAGTIGLTDSPDTVATTVARATYTATVRVRNPQAGTSVTGAVKLTELAPGSSTPLRASTPFTLTDTAWHTLTVSGAAAGVPVGTTATHGLGLDLTATGLPAGGTLAVDDWTLTRTDPVNRPPTASFTSSSHYLVTHFDGSASADPEGNQVGFTWDFGDGTTGTGKLPVHTYAAGGSYRVTLTTRDYPGATGTTTSTVTVVADVPPTPLFTVVPRYLLVRLDATGSTDSDGTLRTFSWDFGDGTTGNGTKPSHTYAAAGTYPVTLTVTDDGGAAATRRVPVTVVADVAPTADWTWTQKYLVVKADASATTDTDGTVSTYTWDFGDGTTGHGRFVSHTYAAAGSHVVTLTVGDDGGAVATRSQTVTVVADVPPVAVFTPAVRYLDLSLDARATTDADGHVNSYEWTFGDGATGTGRVPTHTYAASGTYPVTLVVTDDGGATARLVRSVTVVADVPPTAGIVARNCSFRTARVDGTSSADSDGTIASWLWTWSDGTTSTGAHSWHTFATTGTKSVRLTVTDDAGATATTTRSVTVSPGPAPMVGVYNGYASEQPDERTIASFGSVPQVASTYYQPDANVNVAYETARVLRGTSPDITMTTVGTQLIPAIADGDPTALAWLDRYVASLARIAAVDPHVPVYATLEHEFRAKVNQGLLTGRAADPLVYARALSVFIAKAHAASTNLHPTYWMVGYDRAFEASVGAALTQRPDTITFDPYANVASDTVTSIATGDLTWLRGQSWYDDQPVGLSEFGMTVKLGDAAMARFYSDVRTQLSNTGVAWAVFFNRPRDDDFLITTGAYPQAVAAVSASLRR